jgi:hypothetical protein
MQHERVKRRLAGLRRRVGSTFCRRDNGAPLFCHPLPAAVKMVSDPIYPLSMPSSNKITDLGSDARFESVGLVIRRDPGGIVRANMTHLVCHSPTGFEVGSLGPGTLDLELSALHALLPPPSMEEEARSRALTGEVYEVARRDTSKWAAKLPGLTRVNLLVSTRYEALAEDLAQLPYAGGLVPLAELRQQLEPSA